MTIKEQALSAIQRLPEDANFKDIAEEIALLAALEEAESDIQKGQVVSNEEMKKRIAEWTAG